MTDKFRGLLHRVTHRVPGVRAHAERPAGHQGAPAHGRGVTPQPSRHQTRHLSRHLLPNRRWNHVPGLPPRFLAGWQRRIAAFLGRDSR